MARYQTTRIVPTILVIIAVIIAIVALVSLARVIFFSDGSSDPAAVDTTQESLLSTTAGSSVSMSVRGPIVADENFNSYRIVVSPSSRQLQTFRGYLATVIEEKNLPNNVAAYEEFVHALDKAKFTAGNQPEGEENDVRGICATGRLYEFSILKNGAPVEMLWTSTCSGSSGTLKASADQLNQLFTSQIPDASKMIRSLSL